MIEEKNRIRRNVLILNKLQNITVKCKRVSNFDLHLNNVTSTKISQHLGSLRRLRMWVVAGCDFQEKNFTKVNQLYNLKLDK